MTKNPQKVAVETQRFILRKWYDGKPSKKETPKGTSKTVPDQSLTVLEIIQRSQRGVDIQQFIPIREAVYNEDYHIPDVKKLDFTDLEDMRKNVNAELIKINSQLAMLDEDKNGKPDVIERLTQTLETIADETKKRNSAPETQPKG